MRMRGEGEPDEDDMMGNLMRKVMRSTARSTTRSAARSVMRRVELEELRDGTHLLRYNPYLLRQWAAPYRARLHQRGRRLYCPIPPGEGGSTAGFRARLA